LGVIINPPTPHLGGFEEKFGFETKPKVPHLGDLGGKYLVLKVTCRTKTNPKVPHLGDSEG